MDKNAKTDLSIILSVQKYWDLGAEWSIMLKRIFKTSAGIELD